MKLLPFVAFAVTGVAVIGCGTTRENRYNETAYADHPPYEHRVVYRTPAYGERYYYDDGDVVYVQPAYRVAPVTRGELIYGGDGYYYYRD